MSAPKFEKKPFPPIPNGDHKIKMISLEEKVSKSSGRKMLTATFELMKGEFAKRKVFEHYLREHPNAKVVEIANKKLDNYAKALGLPGGLEDLGQDVTKLLDYLETPVIATLKQDAEPYKGNIPSRIVKFSKQ